MEGHGEKATCASMDGFPEAHDAGSHVLTAAASARVGKENVVEWQIGGMHWKAIYVFQM